MWLGVPMPSDKAKGDFRSNTAGGVWNGANGYRKSQVGWFLRKPDWKKIQLPPFEKKLCEEHPATTSRSMAEVDAYRNVNGVSVKGKNVPKPILSLEESNFPDFVVKSMEAQRDRTSPTRIEAHCWPIALRCRDFLGIDKTGSHKTLAYVVPAVIHVSRQPPLQQEDGPIAVVLAPTRELAKQIHSTALELGEHAGLRSVCVSNGEPKEGQYEGLKKACHICVATPRRLIEFLEEGKVNLHRCTYLVVDDVDRMLAVGFKPIVLKIAELCRPDHQTTMWAASSHKELRPFVEELLHDYIEIEFGMAQLAAGNSVEMTVDVCQEEEKEAKLAELLDDVLKEKSKKAVVFTDTKKKADEIAWMLRIRGWPAIGLHGKKGREERGWIASKFQAGTSNVLVTTDTVARDLVFENVCLVVNYDCPACSEVYARRSSCVARSGEPGVVHTFINPTQQLYATNLIAVLEHAKQPVRPELYDMTKKPRSKR
ncbi:probable ATP-dependent RNA helicase DDX5 [Dermacentor albipictus]|uniref:probable ATP-dependent RNA helicase DDX5 n=1 Tax=Dermacentor albipictus TaxID=60249 RepID=UPI0031FC4C71